MLSPLSSSKSSGLIPAHAGKTERLGLTVPTIRAHPRSRGENPTLLITTPHVQGSSPLTRGKPTRAATVTAPARAHPRSRGENQDENIINLSKQGSSPLTRGKPRSCSSNPQARGAHPRSRGENAAGSRCLAAGRGSSPLTRGKLVTLPRLADEQGLIPAHAGKTGCQVLRLGRRRAHPRSRGENGVAGAKRCVTPGSSPLTRGKRGELLPRGGGRGLIPAHAGKTCSRRRTGQRQRAHPRSRGENAGRHCRSRSRAGSSPLTRGKRGHPGLASDDPGLIPAHAGKTDHRPLAGHTPRAHPRSRGENPGSLGTGIVGAGSSPLTRGKR